MRLPYRNSDFYKNGLPYSNSFKAHTGCVNAVTFSKTNGISSASTRYPFSHPNLRIMASGGDCTTVYLWDLFRDFDGATPIHAFSGPTKNIFTLEFNCQDDTLYCGSNDAVIYKYDLQSQTKDVFGMKSPVYKDKLEDLPTSPPDVRQTSHASSISQISAHPIHSSLILSASSDDELHITDERVSNYDNVGHFHTTAEWRDVKWHPVSEHLFGCCDSRGGVYLNDIRKGFTGYNITSGSFSESVDPFVDDMSVMQYNAQLTNTHASKRVKLDSSSISFNNTGDLFGVIYQHSFPTIYSLNKSDPLAVLTGDYLPYGARVSPGERPYSTSCTTKHCSFEGDYFATGSDDFRGYVWKIPPVSRLLEGRREVSNESLLEGFENGSFGQYRSVFSKSKDEDVCIPTIVNRPAFRLEGHASIVNSAMIHPTLPLVATSGVEKIIKMHTPTPFTNNLEAKETPKSRKMGNETRSSRRDFLMALLTSPYENEEGTVEEDPLTLNFFDSLLRRDQEVDIWNEPDSNDEEDEEVDEHDDIDEDDVADVMMRFARDNSFGDGHEDETDDDDSDGPIVITNNEDEISSDGSEESIDIDEAYPV
ncbi:WD40 repeat-like protein [Wallemia mellicola]|nr:WD40 repeat-like protein [Wallemia mellicola]